MEEGNSIRDTLKDRFRILLSQELGHDEAYEKACDLADAAFDVLGVPPDMQDATEWDAVFSSSEGQTDRGKVEARGELPDKIRCFVDNLMSELANPEIVRIMENCNLEDEEIEAFMTKP